ncbi:hypothetical protein PO428_21905 [Escherichia coli]
MINHAKLQHILEYAKQQKYIGIPCKMPPDDMVEIVEMAIQSFGNPEQLNSPVIPDGWCRTCRPVTISDMRFVVCPECGNKRCPRANNHMNACTRSNEPGQEGSAYPAAPQQEGK